MGAFRGHTCGFVGVDGSEIFEGQISSTLCDFFLTGYMKSGATFNTNAVDITPGATTGWQDAASAITGAGAILAIFEDTDAAALTIVDDEAVEPIISQADTLAVSLSERARLFDLLPPPPHTQVVRIPN